VEIKFRLDAVKKDLAESTKSPAWEGR
jgi:hypothetical protein